MTAKRKLRSIQMATMTANRKLGSIQMVTMTLMTTVMMMNKLKFEIFTWLG